MKFLFKVTKMLPRLETESEILPTIFAIRRILAAEGLDWHAISRHINDFVTSVAGAEEPVLPPPDPLRGSNGAAKGWQTSTRPAAQARPARPQPPPRPQAPPQPPPHYPAGHYRHIPKDARTRGTPPQKLELIIELLVKKIWQTRTEENFLNTIKLMSASNLPLSKKQQEELEVIVDRL
jgi:hypothetical protein